MHPYELVETKIKSQFALFHRTVEDNAFWLDYSFWNMRWKSFSNGIKFIDHFDCVLIVNFSFLIFLFTSIWQKHENKPFNFLYCFFIQIRKIKILYFYVVKFYCDFYFIIYPYYDFFNQKTKMVYWNLESLNFRTYI